MTNKEALEILTHNWTKLVNPDCTDKELGQAQDLAIEALEQMDIRKLEQEAYNRGFRDGAL